MRIAPKPLGAYPWLFRLLFQAQRRKYGQVLQSALVWARQPRLFFGLSVLYGAIDRKSSPIDPALRSLVTVRVSQLNDCAFCVDLNSALLLERSGDMEKVQTLASWRDSTSFNDRERAALDYTEAMTLSNREVDDAIFAALRPHFSEDAIVELTGIVAFQNMSTKFNNALAIPPQGFCRIP